MRSVSKLLIAAAALAAVPAYAQQVDSEEPSFTDSFLEGVRSAYDQITISRSLYASSPRVRSAFRSVVADIRQATVQIRKHGRRIAYGGIVGPDGWVITKASLVRGSVSCRLRDGRELDARLVGIDSETDLAMLKIDAKDLPVLNLGPPEPISLPADALEAGAVPPVDPEPITPLPGDLLATVGLGRDPVAVGVLSVKPRPIEKRRGFLGVSMDLDYQAPDGAPEAVKVTEVQPDSAAAEAGLLQGDLILSADEVRTPDIDALKGVIGGRNPGDRIELEVLRKGETLRLRAMLHGWRPNFTERRAYYQNNLGGKLSERRFGFPEALQHDTVIEADDCGGPVVDLAGRVVGFNISRAGRTETYALPTELVRSKLLDLMSGRLAPVDLE